MGKVVSERGTLVASSLQNMMPVRRDLLGYKRTFGSLVDAARSRRANWPAVSIASLAGGLALLLVDMAGRLLAPEKNLGATAMLEAAAALLVYPRIEPAPPGPGVLVVGLVLHSMLSLAYGSLLLLAVRELSARRAYAVGAAAGLALYVVNFHVVAHLFTSFLPLRGLTAALSHVAFGTIAIFVYRVLRRPSPSPPPQELGSRAAPGSV